MATGRGTVNKVIILGRLGQDPELKYTPAGAAVANISVATNYVWKDQDGNQRDQTEWHRVVIWRKLAEIANEYLKKGSQVYIEGRLQTRSWNDKNNVTRYTTEVVAETLTMLGGRSDRTGSDDFSPPSPQDEYGGGSSSGPSDTATSTDSVDDDLPF